MTTVFLGERPAVVESWLEQRALLGQDRYDEVWAGDYHVVPGPSADHAGVDASLADALAPVARERRLKRLTAFSLGEPDDYRVPDGGLHRFRPSGVFVPTIAAVIEILSPGDETFAKFGFHAARGVEEILVADPAARTVRIRCRAEGPGEAGYEETDHSDLLDVTAASLTAEIDWP